MGRPRYSRARSLLITADAGGSNGARVRLWKWELQQLANRTGLAITVAHCAFRSIVNTQIGPS
jgi:hypothetical protein